MSPISATYYKKFNSMNILQHCPSNFVAESPSNFVAGSAPSNTCNILVSQSLHHQKEVLYHCIFIISQLWLTSHPRGTVVLLDTGTPGTNREIYSEDADEFVSNQRVGVPSSARSVVLPVRVKNVTRVAAALVLKQVKYLLHSIGITWMIKENCWGHFG